MPLLFFNLKEFTMSLIKKLLTVEGITGMVISFIAYKAIVLTLETIAWLQTTLN